jgi:hypothetical protein
MYEFLAIGAAVIVFAILIKIGLKVLKWGIVALLLYVLWRVVMQ